MKEKTENWLNFTDQMKMIDDLFTHGCFVAAHREVKRLERFVGMFAERAMEKYEEEKRANED